MPDNLKPCPFCGNVKIVERMIFVKNSCVDDLPFLKLIIACPTEGCGARTEFDEHAKIATFAEFEFLFSKARSAWNRRAEKCLIEK